MHICDKDMSKVISNASIYLFANVLNSLVPFLLLPVLTRVLTPADYGVIAMFAVALNFVSTITGLNTNSSVGVKYYKLEEDIFPVYLSSCFFILLVTTVFFIAFLYFFGEHFYEIFNLNQGWLMVVVVTASAQFIINVRLSLWQMKKKAICYGIFQILCTLANATFSLYIVFYIHPFWEGRVLGQVAAVVIFAIFSSYTLIKSKDLVLQIDRKKMKEALVFSVPLIPHTLGSIALTMMDRFVVNRYEGPSGVGVYMVALQIGMAIGLIADAFCKVYGPYLYEMLKIDTYNSKLKIVIINYAAFLFFILSVFPAYFLLNYLFPLIVGEDFQSANKYIFWFLLGNSFTGMYYAIVGLYFFSNKTLVLSCISLFSGVIVTVLMFYMVSEYGLFGGSLVFAIGQFLMFVMVLLLSNRVYKLPWLDFSGLLLLVRRRYVEK